MYLNLICVALWRRSSHATERAPFLNVPITHSGNRPVRVVLESTHSTQNGTLNKSALEIELQSL